MIRALSKDMNLRFFLRDVRIRAHGSWPQTQAACEARRPQLSGDRAGDHAIPQLAGGTCDGDGRSRARQYPPSSDRCAGGAAGGILQPGGTFAAIDRAALATAVGPRTPDGGQSEPLDAFGCSGPLRPAGVDAADPASDATVASAGEAEWGGPGTAGFGGRVPPAHRRRWLDVQCPRRRVVGVEPGGTQWRITW